jgi:hypothetical protein
MKTVKWITRLVAGLAVMFSPYYSHANVIYTYTGNAYDSFMVDSHGGFPSDPYDKYNKVTARFTIDQLLEPSYVGTVMPSSFVMSDGNFTITQDNALGTSFWVHTGTDGNISEWGFAAQALLMLDMVHALSIDTRYRFNVDARDMSVDGVCGDIPDYEVIKMCMESGFYLPTDYTQAAWVIGDLGAWTVVPIPPALWLFGSGLLGLIVIARKKAA